MSSLKKEIIRCTADYTSMPNNKNNRLAIVTAGSVIFGTLAKPVGEGAEKESNMRGNATYEIIEVAKRRFGSEAVGDDGFIHLTDVEITFGGGVTTHLDYITVFYDQIVGVTFPR